MLQETNHTAQFVCEYLYFDMAWGCNVYGNGMSIQVHCRKESHTSTLDEPPELHFDGKP